MIIYVYSIPAILALFAKVFILYFSRHAEIQNTQTRIFRAIVILSLLQNIAELLILQKPFENGFHYGGITFYITSALMLALLMRITISISFDNYRTSRFLLLYALIYGYALLVAALLLFTPWIVAGFQDLNGYTSLRIPGPLMWMFDGFILASCLAAIFLPVWGLRTEQSSIARVQCKIWIATAMPLMVLVITIIVLLELKIRLFNATVTTPLLVALSLAAVGYALHNRRIVEPDFYIPWTKARKFKTKLYSNLAALGRDVHQYSTIQAALSRLSEILKCPLTFFGAETSALAGVYHHGDQIHFPRSELKAIERMVVAGEIRDLNPHVYELMKKYHVAAIVPFFCSSERACCWLLLGESFSRRVYTPRDFEEVEKLFRKMAGLFLDKMLEISVKSGRPQAQPRSSENHDALLHTGYDMSAHAPSAMPAPADPAKALPASIAEYEEALIRQALVRCNGNQAQAARLLGVRPNTLHYKIERYGLSGLGGLKS